MAPMLAERRVIERPPEWYCGAPNPKRNKICRARAGHGTDHLGVGACFLHGGSGPGSRIHGARVLAERAAEKQLAKFGQATRDVDPEQALLDLVSEAAGNVAWLGQRVAELAAEDAEEGEAATGESPSRWRKLTGYSSGARLFGPRIDIDKDGGEHVVGEEERAMVKLYGQWSDRLAKYAKAALDAGIEKRRVEMAERQGETIVVVINNVLIRLGLDEPKIIEARRLIAEEFRVMDTEASGR